MSKVREQLDTAVGALRAPCDGCCWQCSRPLPRIEILVCDLDQAYEKCEAKAVLPAWRRVADWYQNRTCCSEIWVQRCRRSVTKVPSGTWERHWWRISLVILTQAVLAYTSMTYAVIGAMVFELDGLSVGGHFSTCLLYTSPSPRDRG